LRLSIKLPEKQYEKLCRAISAAWRQRLFTSSGAIDVAEAVHTGIEASLEFIGIEVT
jgi:hypothetical protein